MKKKILSSLLALCLILSLAVFPASALELDEAKELLQEYYVDEIPESVLSAETLEELLQALGDPYTVYMSAQEYEDFLSGVNGEEIVGIGVSIQTTYNNGFQIMSVLPNSPALEAGLAAGDRIIAVDGLSLAVDSDIQSLLSGIAGTQVTVTVIRQEDGSQQDFTMTRRAVAIPIVTYEQVGTAGVLDCTSFGSSTTSTIKEALEQLDDETVVWIMDLRSNPGGTTESAAGTAGLFSGSHIMVYFRDSNGYYNYLYTVPTMEDMTDKPLIILTSAYSASASELFSSDARDLGFGIAVGQRTFGKGIAQIVLDEENHPDLFDGDSLKVTAYRFYSPNGVTNHNIGILPTLLVSAENAPTVALLLSAKEPPSTQTDGYLKLDLFGFTFYINMKEAMKEENQAAFTELLEAIPTSFCTIWEGNGEGWMKYSGTTPEKIAQKLGLSFVSRCSFSDLSGSPYQDEIQTMATYNLISGYSDGTFRPQAQVTRGEFCAMVASAFNLVSNSETAHFSDVPSNSWYADAISAMASRGFISGYSDGTFHPEDTITYEQMLTILSSLASWCTMEGYDLSQKVIPAAQWPDYYSLSSWAQDPAWRLEQMGLTLNLENPQQPGTRETCAHLIYSVMDLCGLFWTTPTA